MFEEIVWRSSLFRAIENIDFENFELHDEKFTNWKKLFNNSIIDCKYFLKYLYFCVIILLFCFVLKRKISIWLRKLLELNCLHWLIQVCWMWMVLWLLMVVVLMTLSRTIVACHRHLPVPQCATHHIHIHHHCCIWRRRRYSHQRRPPSLCNSRAQLTQLRCVIVVPLRLILLHWHKN